VAPAALTPMVRVRVQCVSAMRYFVTP